MLGGAGRSDPAEQLNSRSSSFLGNINRYDLLSRAPSGNERTYHFALQFMTKALNIRPSLLNCLSLRLEFRVEAFEKIQKNSNIRRENHDLFGEIVFPRFPAA